MKLTRSPHGAPGFALGLLCVVGVSPLAAAPAPPEMSITSTDVNDDRRAENSSLTVRLGLKSQAFKSAMALRATVKTAEDATGQSLISTKPHAFAAFAYDFKEIGKTDNASIDLRLASPPREVMTVKQITGEVEIYTPSDDPQSVVFIDNFGQQTGAALVSPVLKDAGVSITVWTAERYERYKQEEIEKKGIGEALNQGLGNMLGQMFGGSSDSKNNIVFLVKDPSLRLVKMSVVDAEGKLIDNRGKFRRGTAKEMDETFQFDKKLPADARLKLYVATPKSLVKVPFQTQDIALP